jgi:anti-sigma B factor antagonist
LLEVDTIDDTTIVKVNSRRLDEANSQAVSGQLLGLVDHSGRHELHLDLGGVEFIGSTGLGHFVALHKKLRGVGGHLTLHNVEAEVYEVFEVTHLHKFLDVRRKVAG